MYSIRLNKFTNTLYAWLFLSREQCKNQKRVREHIAKMKAAGRCTQCQYPWHDGLCSCEQWKTDKKELDEIAEIAYKLLHEEVTL
jgi:hypothetical protein